MTVVTYFENLRRVPCRRVKAPFVGTAALMLVLLVISAGTLRAEEPGIGGEPGSMMGGPRHGGISGEIRDRIRQHRQEMREDFGQGEGDDNDGQPGPGGMRNARIGRFVQFMERYTTSVRDRYQAVSLATLSIKESYRKKGEPLGAVKELEQYVDTASDQEMRNVLLFSIRQIYEENGNTDKALEISKRIIAENIKAKE